MKIFREKNIEDIIVADKTFIRFHEYKSRTLIPSGKRRVGSAAKIQ